MPRLPFQPFDPEAAVLIYHNNLPHWRQPGATYFVTFRLADSIPKDVLSGWDEEKRVYLKAQHGIEVAQEGDWRKAFAKLSKQAQKAFRKAFDRQLNDYLDRGQGDCVLGIRENAECVLAAARHFDEQRYDLGDLVVMPNHVHLLITPYPGHDLEQLLQSMKGVSARRINERLQRKGSLWQKDSYDHIVRSAIQLSKFQEYIAENPAKAGLARESCVHYQSLAQ